MTPYIVKDIKNQNFVVFDKLERKINLYQNKDGDVQEKYYPTIFFMAAISEPKQTMIQAVTEKELVENFTFVKVVMNVSVEK